MCGICGKVLFRGEVDGETLRSMAQTLAHRGPDDEGFAIDGGVGFAHRRLSIIDLSAAGRQPMMNEDSSIWLICNGEIYNHRELRAGLLARGHAFRSASDSEVILHLYEEEGIECLRSLRGMFALAIHDARRRRVYLARDPFGEKPLYYHPSPAGVTFASELKSLLVDPSVPQSVDPSSIDLFLWLTYIPAPLTGLQGIAKLPAGHLLEVDMAKESIETRPYWRLEHQAPVDAPDEARSFETAAAKIRELLEASVAGCLVADVPVGVFLSGGLDSTVLVALASRLQGRPPKTFSVRFEDDEVDESRFARLVASRFHTEHTEFTATADIVSVLPRLVWHGDVPFGDEAAVPLFHLAARARERVKVVLTGEGGDEVFGGYNHKYRSLLLLDRYRAWTTPGLRRLTARLASGWLGKGRVAKIAPLLQVAAREGLPFWQLWIETVNGGRRRLVKELYTPAFAAQVSRDALAEALARRLDGEGLDGEAPSSPLSEAMRVDIATILADRLLLKADAATMAHGLEARCPFLARDLVEHVTRLPDRMKVTWRENKRLLRRAFADIVPREILARPKMGFRVPVERWLAGDLREMTRDLLLDRRARNRGYFAPAAVEALITKPQTDRAASRLVWRLLMLELWQRTFADRRPAPFSSVEAVPATGKAGE